MTLKIHVPFLNFGQKRQNIWKFMHFLLYLQPKMKMADHLGSA